MIIFLTCSYKNICIHTVSGNPNSIADILEIHFRSAQHLERNIANGYENRLFFWAMERKKNS